MSATVTVNVAVMTLSQRNWVTLCWFEFRFGKSHSVACVLTSGGSWDNISKCQFNRFHHTSEKHLDEFLFHRLYFPGITLPHHWLHSKCINSFKICVHLFFFNSRPHLWRISATYPPNRGGRGCSRGLMSSAKSSRKRWIRGSASKHIPCTITNHHHSSRKTKENNYNRLISSHLSHFNPCRCVYVCHFYSLWTA